MSSRERARPGRGPPSQDDHNAPCTNIGIGAPYPCLWGLLGSDSSFFLGGEAAATRKNSISG